MFNALAGTPKSGGGVGGIYFLCAVRTGHISGSGEIEKLISTRAWNKYAPEVRN